MRDFRNKYQVDSMDCGPACLCMISQYYGKERSLKFFRENSFITREGVTLRGISIADHNRIKSFLMNDTIDIVFSIGTFITFAIVLGIYNWQILTTFLVGFLFLTDFALKVREVFCK